MMNQPDTFMSFSLDLFVPVGPHNAEYKINVGVPQGSVLGPLFNLYSLTLGNVIRRQGMTLR